LENEINKLKIQLEQNQQLAAKNQEITELKIALENYQAEKLEAKIKISPN
jgi:hypothetical protein